MNFPGPGRAAICFLPRPRLLCDSRTKSSTASFRVIGHGAVLPPPLLLDCALRRTLSSNIHPPFRAELGMKGDVPVACMPQRTPLSCLPSDPKARVITPFNCWNRQGGKQSLASPTVNKTKKKKKEKGQPAERRKMSPSGGEILVPLLC